MKVFIRQKSFGGLLIKKHTELKTKWQKVWVSKQAVFVDISENPFTNDSLRLRIFSP